MKEWYFTEEEYQRAKYLESPLGKYDTAISIFNSAKTESDFIKARNIFVSIKDYSDSIDQIQRCNNSIELVKKEEQYNLAMTLVSCDYRNTENIAKAKRIFISLNGYKDSNVMIAKCDNYLKDESLEKARNLIQTNSLFYLNNAIYELRHIGDYGDALQLLDLANERIKEINRKQKTERKEAIKKISVIALGVLVLTIICIVVWAAQPGCMIHNYKDANCTEPRICSVCNAKKGEPLGHKWIDATCKAPKTCERCGKCEGDIIAHKWTEATCDKPKTCELCGDTKGKKKGHKWSKETKVDPKICKICKKMEPKSTPSNGNIIINTSKDKPCKLTIKNQTSNCYVKLKDSDKKDVFAFFVKSNQTVSVSVPKGNYYVYFAYGDDWYGKNYLFGDKTTCSMDDSLQEFTVTSDGNYTSSTHLEYTLYKVYNGNFTPKDIDVSEF